VGTVTAIDRFVPIKQSRDAPALMRLPACHDSAQCGWR